MKELEENVYLRDETVCGIGPWLWPKEEFFFWDEGKPYYDGGLWQGPKIDFEISHQFLILNKCKKFDVVVQAGGGCGMYPRLLAERFQYVYTFEPYYLNFRCLVHNCLPLNIYKMQAALGNENKMIGLCCNHQNLGRSSVVEGTVQGTIPMLRIDQLNLWKCDLIWLDIEEYERYALEGAVETINKFRPVVVLENGDINGIPDFMKELNYVCAGMSAADFIYVPNE